MIVIVSSTLAKQHGHKHHKKHNDKSKDLRYICSKTSDPSICMKAVKSCSRDDHDHALELAGCAIYAAVNLSKDVYGGRDGSQGRGGYNDDGDDYSNHDDDRYSNCYDRYDSAVRDLEKARECLRSENTDCLASRAKDALEEVRDCGDMNGHEKNRKEFTVLCEFVKIAADESRSGNNQRYHT